MCGRDPWTCTTDNFVRRKVSIKNAKRTSRDYTLFVVISSVKLYFCVNDLPMALISERYVPSTLIRRQPSSKKLVFHRMITLTDELFLRQLLRVLLSVIRNTERVM